MYVFSIYCVAATLVGTVDSSPKLEVLIVIVTSCLSFFFYIYLEFILLLNVSAINYFMIARCVFFVIEKVNPAGCPNLTFIPLL